MKISELQAQLEDFKRTFGDCEVEFLAAQVDQTLDDMELEFAKIHDGYYVTVDSNDKSVVCEIRLKP